MEKTKKAARKGGKKAKKVNETHKASVNLSAEVFYERLENANSVDELNALLSDAEQEAVKHSDKVKGVPGEVKMVEYMEKNAVIVLRRLFGDDNPGTTQKERQIFMLKAANGLAKHLKIHSGAVWSGYHKYMAENWEKKVSLVKDTIKDMEDVGEDKFKEFNERLSEFAW